MIKIIVSTELEKKQLLEASAHIHNQRNLDTNMPGVNTLVHLRNNPDMIICMEGDLIPQKEITPNPHAVNMVDAAIDEGKSKYISELERLFSEKTYITAYSNDPETQNQIEEATVLVNWLTWLKAELSEPYISFTDRDRFEVTDAVLSIYEYLGMSTVEKLRYTLQYASEMYIIQPDFILEGLNVNARSIMLHTRLKALIKENSVKVI